MKLNNKLFLITATLGLMAAASSSVMAGNYIHFQNDSSQTVKITANWADGGKYFDHSTSNGNIAPGKCGSITEKADGRLSQNFHASNIYSNLHVKFNGHDDTILNVAFHAHYHSDANRSFDHLQHAEIDQSGYNELAKYSLAMTLTGASSNGAIITTTTPDQEIDGINDTYLNVIFTNAPSSTSSPMGKISNMLHSFKL